MWKILVNDGETKYGPDWTWLDLRARHGGLDKLASAGVYVPPTLVTKIAELEASLPRDKVAFYNRALGSFESFGLNRNGDGFARDELANKHDTFVKNAHYFQHHQNKDPALSRGRPVASAFNDRTDMVDLIICADMDKCAEQIHALESGKRLPTSMGAKVAHDVCTICGHEARRREDYCEHVNKLASAPYGMRAVLDDGRVCGVMNPNPNFFDISDVLIGAAPESETLLKVASFDHVSGAELADLLGLSKVGRDVEATIVKRLPGTIDAGDPLVQGPLRHLTPSEQDLPVDVIERLRAAGGLGSVLKHTAASGIVLKPGEFSRAAKLGSFSPPTTTEILSSEGMPKKILAASLDPQAMTVLAACRPARSAYMPDLVNRLRTLKKTKTAAFSGPEDTKARAMYIAYRRTLVDELGSAGGGEGDYWTVKCAGTASRLYTDVGREYALAAYTKEDNIVNKVLDRMTKMAEPLWSERFGIVTATMADDMGQRTLDFLAVKTLRTHAG